MAIEFELNSIHDTPPGLYRITVEQTGHKISSHDYVAFTRAYESHCVANSIPLGPLWEEELQNTICKQNMPLWSNHCKRVGKFKPIKNHNNFGAMMSFLKMIQNWINNTSEGNPAFVEKAEAERRSTICVTCPYNTKTTHFGCGSCGTAFISLLMRILGKDRKTANDEGLGSCKICQCALKAAVWVPLSVQQQALDEATKEVFRDPQISSYCWKADGV